MKKTIFLTSALVLCLALASCTSTPATDSTASSLPEVVSESTVESTSDATSDATSDITSDAALKTFTAEELSKFNGKDDPSIYVAYNGNVYDVTTVEKWATGEHEGNMAGTDITAVIESAPHGATKLTEDMIVGTYIA